MLVNGMGCYFPGRDVRLRDGVLVNGMGCHLPGGCVVYGKGC